MHQDNSTPKQLPLILGLASALTLALAGGIPAEAPPAPLHKDQTALEELQRMPMLAPRNLHGG